MKFRKHNVELSYPNMFEEMEHMTFDNPELRLSWDWHFESSAFDTKNMTVDNFEDLLECLVENRTIISDVFNVCSIDFPTLGVQLDGDLYQYMQYTFVRMVKTSKVIQDLTTQGSYVEAKALLRSNFERAVLLQYFSTYPDKLNKYLKAKKDKDRKTMSEYNIKKLTEVIKKDYADYQYLCDFVHPNWYSEDLLSFYIQEENWFAMTSYVKLIKEEAVNIYIHDNNLLLETFNAVMRYLTKNLRKDQVNDDLKEILDSTKKLRFIKLEKR